MISIKNGIYIPIIYFISLYLFNNDYLLSTSLSLRFFTINYFFWFQKWTIEGQMKQFVRFTDSQTILCLLNKIFYKNKIIKEITFYIFTLITFGFWIFKFFNIDETTKKTKYPFLQSDINNFYHYINHGLLYLLFNIKYFNDIKFTINGFKYTLIYILFYIMIIYIPWYFITDDRIYDI